MCRQNARNEEKKQESLTVQFDRDTQTREKDLSEPQG